MDHKKIHENYHSRVKLQKRIINEKNFTYRNIVVFLNPYLKKNMHVLNVGCGVGTMDFYLSDKVNKIIGIDISDNAIGAAKKSASNFKLRNIKYISGDVSKYKFITKFDLIICSEIIEHVKDDRFMLRSLAKLLNKNGLIFITTPLITAPMYRFGLAKGFDKRVGHLRRYKSRELKNIVKENKLKIVEVEYKEGLFRNILFSNQVFDQIIRIANKFSVVSDIFNLVDQLSLRLFGASGIYIIAKK